MRKVLGIDVSHYEPPIDWQLARASGVEIMYAKCTQGKNFVDHSCFDHVDAAAKAGVKTGVYHFLHPSLNGEEQAQHFLKNAPPVDLPYCLDWEINPEFGYHNAGLFLDELLDHGNKMANPIIYSGYSFIKRMHVPEFWSQFPLWMAHYGIEESEVKIPFPWTKLYGWQFTDAGGPPLIQGLAKGAHVDTSWFYID